MSRIATRITRSGRTLEDVFFKRAKAAGFVARSAYKLEELQRRFRLIPPRGAVLDLGCHPGAWLQVACRELGPQGGAVVGVDLAPAVAVPQRHCDARVRVLRADARDLAPSQWRELIPKDKDGFDVVLSDMCHATLGAGGADAARSMQLARTALDVALGKDWERKSDDATEMEGQQGDEGGDAESACREDRKGAEGSTEDARGVDVEAARSGRGERARGADAAAETASSEGLASQDSRGNLDDASLHRELSPGENGETLAMDGRERATEGPDTSSSSASSPASPSLPRPGVLMYGGNVAMKILQGPETPALGAALRQHFAKVAWLRPQATRSESSETYLVGLGRLTDTEKRKLEEERSEKKKREKEKKLHKKNKKAKKKKR